MQRLHRVGLRSFEPHEALELLLFFCIPQKDTNPLAHELINKFGSFAAVLNAPHSELLSVKGIGAYSAAFLRMIPQFLDYYSGSVSNSGSHITNTREAGEFFAGLFKLSEGVEAVYMACLDAKGKILNCRLVTKGDFRSAMINIRKVVEVALMYNAYYIVLAHNHPSGIALPSHDDEYSTRKICEALKPVEIQIFDHLIFADSDFVSMRESGMLSG
jgi:DNA repair protein RadC